VAQEFVSRSIWTHQSRLGRVEQGFGEKKDVFCFADIFVVQKDKMLNWVEEVSGKRMAADTRKNFVRGAKELDLVYSGESCVFR
jgi:hypothetical protein